MDQQLMNKIDAYVEANRSAMAEDLKTLVRIPSVSKSGEDGLPFGKGCARVLDKALEMAEEKGLTPANHNYYYGTAAYGAGDKTIGVFSHLDVVPEGDGWIHPPYDPTEQDGLLIGRGVADNKNAAVVGMYLLRAFRELDLPLQSKLSLYFGCAEETGMADIARYVAEQPMPDFSIVPDTGFPVCHGEKGILRLQYQASEPFQLITSLTGGLVTNMVCGKAQAALPYDEAWAAELKLLARGRDDITVAADGAAITVEARGIPSHAAHPEGSRNAIRLLAEFLLAVKALPNRDRALLELVREALGDDYAQHLGADFTDEPSGRLTCVCGLADTREGRLVLDFNIRYPVTDTGDRVRGAMDAFFAKTGWQNILTNDSTPAYMPADDPKVQMLAKIYTDITGLDGTPYTMGGGTYARKLQNAVGFGMEPAEPDADFGPGHGGAHQPDEVIRIDTLAQALKVYILSVLEIDRILHN